MLRRLPVLLALSVLAALLPVAAAPAQVGGVDEPERAEVERVSGPGRIETAIAAAQAGWETAETVLLASAEDYPDALVAAALAAAGDAPILLTESGHLSPAVADEIERLEAEQVVILGGREAVGADAELGLNVLGVEWRRLFGSTRYGTAAAIATEVGAAAGEVVLASGANFPDALAAGALAATPERMPALLTAPTVLSGEAEEALEALEAERVWVLGGSQAVAPAVLDRLRQLGYRVDRLGGPTRYDTAALVAAEALQRRTVETLQVVAATGDRFPDALAAAALAARSDDLLILVPTGSIVPAARTARILVQAGERFDAGTVVGGPAAISEAVREALAVLLGAVTPPRTPTATGTGGAASTVTPLATEAALTVLAAGGNAVDAAVAAGAVVGVVQPYSAGIGGGGFMVLQTADGELTTIDSREEAPAGFDAEVFLDAEGNPIPFAERVVSGLGVGVPGTVAGWELALERYGTMGLDALLQPAIELARYGFRVDETMSAQTEANREKLGTFSSTRELYLRGGRVPAEGSWLRNPDLADTYARIASGGAEAFYGGQIAEALVDAVREPPVVEGTERNVRPSPMVLGDVEAYEALERAPVVSDFRGHTVVGMGLPSSGGLTIALALNMIETFDEGATRDEVLHRYLEALRLAWADRNGYMGDPAFVDVPVDGLLSEEYAADRAALIGLLAADEQRQPGNPADYEDGSDARAGTMVETRLDGSTTHLTVADAQGTVVSYTFTIESIGGSGIVVPGHGFLLNNELTDFDPVPPHPNEPAARKRPRSSMSPTIVLRDGEPVLAVGTPGGATIISTVLQILVDTLENDRSLPEAVAAPRVANFNPANLRSVAEPEFLTTPEAAALQARGHAFDTVAEIGAATGIAFGPDGEMTAVAEPRRRGVGSAGVLSPDG
jgi:gamma-glutamyltranspeptidase / glutathione hydrolase